MQAYEYQSKGECTTQKTTNPPGYCFKETAQWLFDFIITSFSLSWLKESHSPNSVHLFHQTYIFLKEENNV